jgi:serine/threonine protein kinase
MGALNFLVKPVRI